MGSATCAGLGNLACAKWTPTTLTRDIVRNQELAEIMHGFLHERGVELWKPDAFRGRGLGSEGKSRTEWSWDNAYAMLLAWDKRCSA